MAFAAATVWEVRTTGSSTNGGGYSTGGTDYSQQDAAQLTVTDAACTGNTTVTSTTGGFTSAMVGNIMYLSSGPDRYEITAYTDTNTVTIDRNGPNATGMTCNVGGAIDSPTIVLKATGGMIGGNTVWIKSGTYSVSSSMDTPNGAGTSAFNRIVGYNSTRGDLDYVMSRTNFPVLQASAAVDIVDGPGFYTRWENLHFDGNDTGTRGLDTNTTYNYVINCHFSRLSQFGLVILGSSCHVMFCSFTDLHTGATAGMYIQNSVAYRCVGYDTNVGAAYQCAANAVMVECVAHNCASSTGGFLINGQGVLCLRCTSDGNAANGFDVTSEERVVLLNCLATNNTSGSGVDVSVTADFFDLQQFYCGFYNNSTNSNVTGIGDIEISAGTPYVDQANDDLRLNATASQGALLRAGAFGSFPAGLSASFDTNVDVGASQHADPAGGGGMIIHPGMTGGING